jgi:hypothetical protein
MTYRPQPGDPYVDTPVASEPQPMTERVEWRLDPHAVEVHAVVDGDLVTFCGVPAPETQLAVAGIADRKPGRAYVPVCAKCVALARELAAALQRYITGAEV